MSRPRIPAPTRALQPSAGEGSASRLLSHPWAVAAGLALLCIAAYANGITTGFALDSRQLILRDPRVHALTWDNLRLIAQHTYWWPNGESGLYRPLTTVTYLLNYAAFGNGERPAGYHVVNVLLHITNVVLLWRVVVRLTGRVWPPVAAAALWAVVPLSTEAVTNIVGRADLLATAASLSALLLYVRARETGRGWNWRLVPVACLIAAGSLAKESAIAIVGALLLVEALWWSGRASRHRLLMLAACCVVPVGLWAWQRALVLAAGGAAEFPFTDNPIAGAPFWQGRLTAVQVMWRYLTLLAWPARLSADYSYPQIPLATGTLADWASVILLVTGSVAALWQLRVLRPALFFALFALITFLPASNLLFATGTIMGERLLYLPSAGILAVVAIGIAAVARDGARRQAATVFVAVVTMAYGARTVARNRDWTDDLTLWRSTVAAAPASAKAHRALAEALYEADPTHRNLDEVIASADRAVALLEPLEDERNTFQAFRQAGAYYLDKATQVEQATPANPAERRRLYSRALHLLDRAVVIARLGASQLPGGSMEPEADAQRLRAAAILGLENPSLALVAAKRSRELSPLHPLGYRLSTSALLAMHRDEEAVMTLLTGSIVSGDQALGRDAMSLYAQGADPEGCALVGAGASAALNPQCSTVVRHSCIASAAALQILTKAGQTGRAAQTRDTATAAFACPADLFDRPNGLVP